MSKVNIANEMWAIIRYLNDLNKSLLWPIPVLSDVKCLISKQVTNDLLYTVQNSTESSSLMYMTFLNV